MYCQYLANNHVAISSVKNYLSGARTWVHEHLGNTAAFMSTELALMIKSVSKKSQHVTKRAQPLSYDDIRYVSMYLDSARNAPPAIKPCILIGYSCYLRGSNLVSPSHSLWGGTHTILAKNIFVTLEGLMVVIMSTKSRIKPYVINIPYGDEQQLCPVRAWVNYKRMVNPVSTGPAFILADGAPVTSKVVLQFIKTALGNDPSRDVSSITLHSLRRGAVKNAQQQGVPKNEIMDVGAWSSSSGLKPYLQS